MAVDQQAAVGSRRRGLRIVAGLVVLGVLAGALWLVFSGGLALRSDVEIVVAEARPQSQVYLEVVACGSRPHLALLDESETAVEVGLYIWRSVDGGGGDCAESITLDLSEPLGARAVIDASTGRQVPPTR